MWFKYIEGGTITAAVWLDGTKYAGSASLSSGSGGAGAGVDLPGEPLAGENAVTVTIQNPNADVVRALTLVKLSRSIGFYLVDSSDSTNWLFMGVHLTFTPLVGKPLTQTERVTVSV
mgnify:FL=1